MSMPTTTTKFFTGVWQYDLSKAVSHTWYLVATPLAEIQIAYVDHAIASWHTQLHPIKGVYAFAELPNRPLRDTRPIYTAVRLGRPSGMCALCGKHRSVHRRGWEVRPLGSPEYCPS